MSNPPATAPATPATQPQPQQQSTGTSDDNHRMIINYLTQRGYHRAVQQLQLDMTDDSSSSTPGSNLNGGGRSVGLSDLAQRNAPSLARTNSLAGGGNSSNGSGTTPNVSGMTPAQAAQALLLAKRRPDQQMLTDAPSWEKGYEGLRMFVENSLDIHRAELFPLLLPLFVHSYLDLVLIEFREAADRFLERFSSDHSALDPHIIRMLAAIRLASHVAESEEATRWRQERYQVRLSERGWGLLIGWLQGGGLAGSIEGTEARGRDRVLAIINERVKIEKFAGPPAKLVSEYGLVSDFASKKTAKGLDELKLGPAPIDPKLQREVQRTIKDEDASLTNVNNLNLLNGGASTSNLINPIASTSTEPQLMDSTPPVDPSLPPLISPYPAEIPPYPTSMRTIDVAREVEKVREARKRIKLGAEAYLSNSNGAVMNGMNGTGKGKMVGGEAAKPSVCLFTIHDAGESLNTATFSEDSTLLAAGFSESYIRLWNLKGGTLPALRSDFETNDITDANSLNKLKQKAAPTSRKLIGHSGPVYSLSFDPVPGPSGPPRYLLSASQDTTIRLWSLETYTNLVAYRGHREPVWDVEWGPKGIYFASASRDKTARLWTSDKVSAVRIFVGHLSDVNCVRFHPNSLYLATGSSDRTCRLWDVQKGTCVRVFVGHRGPVFAVAISPDGRYLASASDDLTIILWDLASGSLLKTLRGHTSSIHSLSFSAESTVLISGSADSTVRIWDVLALPDESNPSGLRNGKGDNSGSLKGRRASAVVLAGVAGKDGEGKKGKVDKDGVESSDLLATLATKRTPVLEVKFTPRNLCLAVGTMTEFDT